MANTPIPRRLRFEVLRRDSYTCRYCGAQAPDVPLTVDHVIPRALGGADDPTNLVTACRDCNAGKASTSPDEHVVADVDAAAMLFAAAMEKVSAQRRSELQAVDELLTDFERRWTEQTTYGKNGEYRAPLPIDWTGSVTRFLEAGFTPAELDFYIDTAWRQCRRVDGVFRYFCGCIWRELTTRQEAARRLIEDAQT